MVFCLLVATLQAQTTTSYYCDFEDAAEASQWVLNAGNRGKTSSNQWYLGAAGSFGIGSTQGLYIAETADTTTCGYTATNFSCYQVAYRDLTLASGTYTIQLDWKALGQTNDELLVFWTPSTTNIFSNWNAVDQSVPTWQGMTQAAHLRGKATWRSYTGTFNVGATGGRLVLMWVNKKGVASSPAAAVDNIRIYQGSTCASVSSVMYDTRTKTLSWNGSASEYDVLVYNNHTAQMTPYTGLTQTTLPLPSLTEEGMYYFYVRANCGDSLHTSDWNSCSQFVWIPGARCLDFMDLDGAKCYRGPFDDVTGSPTTTRGKVDHGYESVNSFHTIHYMPGETDPRTLNRLKTIPQGEIASVRLGNWQPNSPEGEAIEYTYAVRGGMSDIMEINYAVVMEKPGHGNDADPHFTLEILDQNGKQIGGSQQFCYKADFAAASYNPANPQGWNLIPKAQLAGVEGVSDTDILWKPWTLVSVSLRNYVGQTLTIRLTTKDCAFSAHWAYAYFTIGCRSGDLQGIACGDYETDHFDAPEGFDYRWYWEGNPSKILGTDSRFDISKTTDSIYIVDIISKTAGGCYYSLTANPNPRYPKAEIQVVDVRPRNCENKVKIQNDCRVHFFNRKTGQEMPSLETEPVEAVYWNWGDGSEVEEANYATVEHVFPATGGTFNVSVRASMSGGVCTDDTTFTVTMPNILQPGSVDTTYHKAFVPYKSKFGHTFTADRDTMYVDSAATINMYGCDAWNYEYIYFFTKVTDLLEAVVCEGDSAYFPWTGRWYHETCMDSLVIEHPEGTDTTHYFSLYVVPRLHVMMPLEMDICGRDRELRIPLDIEALGADQYAGAVATATVPLTNGHTLQLREESMTDIITLQLPHDTAWIQPDYYTVHVTVRVQPDPKAGTLVCSTDALEGELLVRYDSTVIDQKFEYVALLNPAYNYGGWSYDDIHWYVDDYELYDQRKATFLHTTAINTGMHYKAELRRTGHDKLIPTCELTYTGQRAVPLQPNTPAPVRELGTYDVTGNKTVLSGKKGLYFVVYDNHETKKVLVY